MLIIIIREASYDVTVMGGFNQESSGLSVC